MGRPIDLNTTIANLINIVKINNIQHQKDETHQRQFILALGEETVRKETQVQTEQKVEPLIVQVKAEKEGKKRKKKRENDENQQLEDSQYDDVEEEEHHIDIKV